MLTLVGSVAKVLVQRLMCYDQLGRATILQALDERWIRSSIRALEEAYANRILAERN